VSAQPSAPAVVVDGLAKTFRFPQEQTHTLKERALHPFRRSPERRFTALRGTSFSVAEGEFFGIVGRNGSGKSTLLKCLAGIYRADAGRAWIDGRLSTFIELGVGFNMDLPARDNIRLNGVMLGLSTAESRAREEEVIAFAGLEGFEDLKIKNYSSGMLVRLGFSILIHVEADVLLIDEVLAVGDAEFQQKCYEQFDRIRAEGRTVLFVTHDMAAVQRYCDRALLLERGEVVALGRPGDVAQEYLRLIFAGRRAGPGAGAARATPREHDPDRSGDGRAEIVDAWFEDREGEPTGALRQGEPASLVMSVRFHEEVPHPVFGVTVGDAHHPNVLSLSSAHRQEWTGVYAAGDEVVCRLRFDNVLAAGQYVATPSLGRHGVEGDWLDRRDAFVPIVVVSAHPATGLVVPAHDFELEPAGWGAVRPA
jgi:ABC-type polysaccharide/polyol phosphate transport system ATPase subunit